MSYKCWLCDCEWAQETYDVWARGSYFCEGCSRALLSLWVKEYEKRVTGKDEAEEKKGE